MLLIPHRDGDAALLPVRTLALYTESMTHCQLLILLYEQRGGAKGRLEHILGFPAVSLPGRQLLPSLVTKLLMWSPFSEMEESRKFFPWVFPVRQGSAEPCGRDRDRKRSARVVGVLPSPQHQSNRSAGEAEVLT